ncbi:hypothetical protein CI102_14552 [Trichoderma harzianum]|uniref:Uncharacterized protein n=1 Tax=Trichoderma harzianum CBS 226.95 TaxID=983964 RepID=A0A2T3ZZT7_TRIHA|nr:hypothetical protein M431DRAFT_249902 [Trichoderma harzianum CBS 226.95]PKK41986.1 hypothetical protein CI102_14552 [Trichoderma harzianum]PTB50327.1 hypothetical protein M431DRAFT_249902 [Trichoderma harzianum CBS 226.95]
MWGSSRSPSGNLSLELRLQRAGRKTGERIRYVAASGELGSACSLGKIGPGSFLALIRGQKRDSKEGGWRRTSERAGEKARSRRKYNTVQTASRRESTLLRVTEKPVWLWLGRLVLVWSDPVRSWSTWPLRFLFLGRGEAPGRPGGAPIVWNCTVWM